MRRSLMISVWHAGMQSRQRLTQQQVVLTEEFLPHIAVALATVVMLEPFMVRHRHRMVDERW